MEKRDKQPSGQENFRSPETSSAHESLVFKGDSTKSRFAYLGNSEMTAPQPSTLEQQLWRIYGTEENEGISDGTLQHEISRVIKGEDL